MDTNQNIDNEQKSQRLITYYFKPIKKEVIKGYNQETTHYHCLECGIDMGNYPGQLCRKWYCDEKDYFV
jgi:hypothetical protein